MKIKRMTATFGALQNQTIELNGGLNVITAPNESGKSTWCAFIKAMLYGVDSSAREKAGQKPDKVKFAPWSGSPMSGTMEVEYTGRNITLTRRGTEKNPLRELSVTYSGTSQPVEGLGANVGETITGVPREVFERSAFIGQGAVTVGASTELEKRISAIVQTGDENSSCTEAVEKLRAEMRKRRYNRSGAIPEIEVSIAAEKAKIAEIEAQSVRGEQLRMAKQRAVEKRDTLTEQVAESRKESRKAALDQLTVSRTGVREMESELSVCIAKTAEAEKALLTDYFGAKPLYECSAQAAADIKRIESLDEQLDQCGKKAGNRVALAVFAALTVLFAAVAYIGLTVYAESVFFWVGFVGAAATVGFALLAMAQLVRMKKLTQMKAALTIEMDGALSKYGCSCVQDIEALVVSHRENLDRLGNAEQLQKQAEQRLAAEKQLQEKLDAQLLRDLDFTESGDAALLTKQLNQAEEEHRRVREEYAAWEGRFSAIGDRRAAESRVAELSAERDRLCFEYDALELAVRTLAEAGTEIQNRMTPLLSKRTAEIFARLTGGRYDAVALDRELKAVARPAEESVAYDTAFLSVGAVDQLYLAVRLAICELALPGDEPCPIILDDALVNFDDGRCLEALKLLKETAQTRQVILFTCHSRETQLLERIDV